MGDILHRNIGGGGGGGGGLSPCFYFPVIYQVKCSPHNSNLIIQRKKI